ncbi:MAG: hypothetical protein II403_07305 [Prevotella sp.]|jgi:hypothetical protein|nr:hypothetical protein [Prevotella sp.]
MSQLKNKLWPWLLSLLFGMAVFLFWWQRYPFALSYHEQFQLFLFDSDYLATRLAEPGGIARYLSEFLVQFYNNVVFGAVIIALLLVLMQRLVWRLMDQQNKTWYPLSFLPSLVTWYMMGDQSLLLAFPLALIMVLSVMACVKSLGMKRLSVVALCLLILVPLVYWVCGPVVLMLAVYLPLSGQKPILRDALLSVAAVVYGVLCILLSSLIVPYTVSQLFCGLGYYRFFESFMLLMILLQLLLVALPLCGRFLPEIKVGKAHYTLLGVQVVALTVLMLAVVPTNYDAKTYELIEYDYLVRTQQWDAVIKKAEQQTPDLPMSVCATNLALAMKGELTTRAFDFYQRGGQGLLPPFERNYTTTLVTGEAYFQLGLVNTAQRFAFEAMEAIPNYNKSVRCVRRLAETNLINGNYEVARKYLKMLEKTMFYGKWAQRTEALLGQEQQINNHPLYGQMRKKRIKEDFLFSDRELDKICGQLLMADKDNTLALQYLLMFPVLDRDLNRFMNYMMFVSQTHPGYSPRICQEMVTFAYASRKQQPPQGVVPEAMLQQFNQFMQAYQQGATEMFRHSTWYYLMGK